MATALLHANTLIAGFVTLGLFCAVVSGEKFHFPDFVAIEHNESPVCGGWIIDKPFRRYVLTTERCATRAPPRDLLVRHGTARVTWRTYSSGVDRILHHPSHDPRQRLVVLSTFGKFPKQPIPGGEGPALSELYNGTVVLGWRRNQAGFLEKSILILENHELDFAPTLVGHLLCNEPDTFLVEGGLLVRNLKPYAMLSVVPDETGRCGMAVDVVDVGSATAGSQWSLAILRDYVEGAAKLEDSSETSVHSVTDPNTLFGYIVYMIFLGYSMLYTLLYFVFGVGGLYASTSL
ncbi:uncharacterized protein LOC131215126 [Anopheles bellator]|uniref:uncharacterized protein LOC131215126 n=1 Tax=Anopheles bellator TaxID=139047 RepID=UPI0026477341|nr:uncharacterized protein LOC131215126 [Anopheles bellator]